MNRIELEDILFELHDKGLRNLKFSMTRVTNQVQRYATKQVIEQLESLKKEVYKSTTAQNAITQRIKALKE